jgi:hypothetical protein
MRFVKSFLTVLIFTMCVNNFAFGQSTTTTTATTTRTVKKTTYPYFSINPSGGVIFPLFQLSESFKPNATIGLDLGYRVNKEVGFFLDLGYYFISSSQASAPVGKYIEFSVGPRYYFTHPSLKSSLFVEGGVGGYSFNQASFVNPSDPSGTVIPQIEETRAGVNAGLGATLGVSDNVDISLKSKYHMVFSPNGSSSFITTMGGINIKFLD